MPRGLKIVASTAVAVGAAGALVSCAGEQSVRLARSSPYYHGAELFSQHCSGCHTLDSTGSQGSATRVRDREHTDAPDFNVRKEQVSQVLYAIRNGGFSGAIMPENIVVGADAQAIARFLARYSGLKAKTSSSPGSSQGSSGAGPSGG